MAGITASRAPAPETKRHNRFRTERTVVSTPDGLLSWCDTVVDVGPPPSSGGSSRTTAVAPSRNEAYFHTHRAGRLAQASAGGPGS